MSLKVLSLLFIGILVVVGAQDFYCPGQTVEFTCRDALLVKWQGSALTAGQCPGGTISFLTGDLTPSDVGNTTTCGIFTATIISLEPGSVQGLFVVNVSLSFTATLSLNGLTVQCEDGVPDDPLELDVLLTVPETTTPTISVDQVSQESVNVNFVLDDNRCVSNYYVNVTEADDNTTTTRHSGTMSPVTVTGLDICQYNYSFVGYVTEQNGDQSNVSVQVDFMIDFTVINPVTVTVDSPPQEPILSWVHDVTPLYTTCVIEFLVTSDVDNNTFNTTVGPNVRSLTTQQLNNAGFEYCVPLRPVVTPITGMGLLTLRSAMGGDTYLLDPDFPTPMLSYSFSLRLANESLNETEDTVTLRVTIQSVSVPTRTFQYNINAGSQTSETSFTGDYFEIDLGGAQGGEVVGVTVNFQDRQCRTTASADYTVPSRETSTPALSESTVNSLTATATLPLTEYQPEELQIISSIEPADSGPITANFTGPGSQYTVMFNGLDPGTSYTVTIRIVLSSNNSMDVVNATTGTFMTLTTPPPPTTQPTTPPPTTTPTDSPTVPAPAPGGCGGGCIGGIISVLAAVFVVMIVVIVVSVIIRKKKKCGSMKVTSHEMEQQHKLTGTNGEEPSSPVKDEPATSDTFKTDGTSPGDQADSGNGATGGEGGDPAALIYADLDIAKKSKPKDPDTPTGAAATGGEESVHYATIDHLKKDEGTEAEGTS